MSKPVVLVFVAYYLPGFKSGGPVRSIANLVERLGDEFTFKVVTADRDYLSKEPYDGITPDAWNVVGKASVYYLSPAGRSLWKLARLIRETPHDVLYLNSFFDPVYTLRPLLARRLGMTPGKTTLVLAPRGEFSRGALGLKPFRKRVYMMLARMVHLLDGVVWQASTAHERQDIERTQSFGRASSGDSIREAIDMPPCPREDAPVRTCGAKAPGEVRVVFLSRITAMKNLLYALEVVAKVQGRVVFDVYGPIDRDTEYWHKCESAIASLPGNVTVTYQGAVDATQVADCFAGYHLFLFPTLGENYGHVIQEALAAGCAVLLSDQTPWQDLDRHEAGWVIPLDQPGKYVEVLQRVIDMTDAEAKELAASTWRYALRVMRETPAIDQNRALFGAQRQA